MVHTVRRRYKKGRNRCVDKIALSKEGNVGTGGTLPMRGSASVGRNFKPCGGEKFRRKACVFAAEGRRVFLSQREGVCFCQK